MPGPSPLDETVAGGIKADQSDAAERLRRKPARRQRPAPVVKPPSGAGTGLLFVLVLVVAGIGFYFQQREADARDAEIATLRAELAGMQETLEGVTSRLNETGASLTEAGSETDRQIRFLDSEIRKLWGVANDRNRKAIGSLESRLDKFSGERAAEGKLLAGLESRVKQLETSLGAASRSGEQAQKEVARLAGEFRDLKAAQARQDASVEEGRLATQTRIDQVSAQVSALANRLRATEQASGELAALTARLATIEQTAASNEQAIRSIDAFRKQTNRSLTTLQGAVNDMQQDLDAMKRVY